MFGVFRRQTASRDTRERRRISGNIQAQSGSSETPDWPSKTKKSDGNKSRGANVPRSSYCRGVNMVPAGGDGFDRSRPRVADTGENKSAGGQTGPKRANDAADVGRQERHADGHVTCHAAEVSGCWRSRQQVARRKTVAIAPGGNEWITGNVVLAGGPACRRRMCAHKRRPSGATRRTPDVRQGREQPRLARRTSQGSKKGSSELSSRKFNIKKSKYT